MRTAEYCANRNLSSLCGICGLSDKEKPALTIEWPGLYLKTFKTVQGYLNISGPISLCEAKGCHIFSSNQAIS